MIMTGLITNLIIKRIPRINWVNTGRYSTPNTAVSEQQIKTVLRARFPGAADIKVQDVSGGCGAMFEIYVETPEFKGLPVVKQHKSVYEALKNQIKQIHAVQLVTKVPS